MYFYDRILSGGRTANLNINAVNRKPDRFFLDTPIFPASARKLLDTALCRSQTIL